MQKKYKIIYADPPWHYNVWGKKGSGRSAESHYPTMSKEQLQSMKISDIAEKDCALFLWAVIPSLPEAFELIIKWGFTYKTVAFVWVKKNKNGFSNFWGLGHWTRSNIEVVLLATKGSPKRKSKGVHQITETFEEMDTETIEHRILAHSQKPHEVRKKIIELMGDVPRLELFARERFEGWDAFGNEIDDSIEIPDAVMQPPHLKANKKQQVLNIV